MSCGSYCVEEFIKYIMPSNKQSMNKLARILYPDSNEKDYDSLTNYLYVMLDGIEEDYEEFTIKKKNGKLRTICKPKRNNLSLITKHSCSKHAEHIETVKKAKKDIVNLQTRCDNLDALFKRLYKDMVSGRISNERFDMMSSDYETEQKNIKAEIVRLQELIDMGEQEQYDLNQFLKNVRKYTDPETLTVEMVNELIDKIVVHAPDKSSGHRRQKIDIYYKAIGMINIADDEDLVAVDGRDKWREVKETA